MKTAIILTLSIIMSVIAFAEDKNYPPKYPWHLADVWWTATNETENFEQISIDFEIIGKLSEDVNLYIAPMGLGELNKVSFYGGIQTNTGGWENKESKEIIKLGKGGIFSRWAEEGKPISLEYAQGDSKTHYESAGYEGNFVSVRKKIDWDQGKYTFFIRKMKTVNENSIEYTWFGAFIFDTNKKQETYIGSLKFKGNSFIYGKKHAAFIEVYGVNSEIPQVTVIFDKPKINGKYQKTQTIGVNYPNNGYNSETIPRFAYVQKEEDKIVIVTIPRGLNDGKTSEILQQDVKGQEVQMSYVNALNQACEDKCVEFKWTPGEMHYPSFISSTLLGSKRDDN